MYILAAFILQNFEKTLSVDPELWGWAIFGPKMVHLPQTIFLGKIIIVIIYLLAPFIVQNFKKVFQWIQSYDDVQFLGRKWPISPNENFFSENLIMILASCSHDYLHAKRQIQILIY